MSLTVKVPRNTKSTKVLAKALAKAKKDRPRRKKSHGIGKKSKKTKKSHSKKKHHSSRRRGARLTFYMRT
jgi:hypothetical protein